DATIGFLAAYGQAADIEFSCSWDHGDSSSWSKSTTWTMNDIRDGVHTFKVRARDWSRNEDPTPAVFNFEVDATPPTALLATPSRPVTGVLEIRGTAADPRFHHYRLDAHVAGREQWNVSPSTY